MDAITKGLHMPTLGARFRQARKRAGLTQEEVAAYEDTTQANISYLEPKDYDPPLADWLRRLSKRYGVSTDWLLSLTDDTTPVSRRELSPAMRELRKIVDEMTESRRQELIHLAREMLRTQKERKRIMESDPEVRRMLDLIELQLGKEARRRAEDMS